MSEEDTLYQAAVLPGSGPVARLIVLERSGAWAVALRRELPLAAIRLEQTRSLSDGWAALHQAPASFLVLELTAANWAMVLERLLWLPRDFPLARVALVADRRLAEALWGLRPPSVVDLITSPRRISGLARAVRRHMAGLHSRPMSTVERIWSELPWNPDR